MARFAQGKYTLKNPEKYIGGRTPTYRSSWEFAFCRMCDTNENITKWASESIRIPYRHPFTGKYTIYVPDFFIVYGDRTGKQHVELIEVKPANHTFKEQLGRSQANKAHYVVNQAKWAAARQYCKQKGMYFRVVNEQDIFHQGKRR
mgnify:FL=1|jgi:hypothetical protein|tara:strand:+ start:739 stop:1176 length:438 start_codon:yes stop_codon:yes gene_type:complete